jgi:hypothetical protein
MAKKSKATRGQRKTGRPAAVKAAARKVAKVGGRGKRTVVSPFTVPEGYAGTKLSFHNDAPFVALSIETFTVGSDEWLSATGGDGSRIVVRLNSVARLASFLGNDLLSDDFDELEKETEEDKDPHAGLHA